MEKLILSVSEYPEMYNVTLSSYRDIGRKTICWRKISLDIEDECKKTWKNLRDRYIKERRKVREKKSSAGAEQKIIWKYFPIMSFLEPYVRERATSSNMSPSSQNRPSSPQATSVPLPASSSGTPSDETFSLYLTEVIPTTQTTSTSGRVDEEELFLLSLAPRLRNLPPERRSEVKLQFMTSLHRAEFSK
uniref:MADF domain-containing protein n=1 Tax=Paramormyrops kingsleyae TaxID=1676925 RepID=A0A3B3QW86_9TELE